MQSRPLVAKGKEWREGETPKHDGLFLWRGVGVVSDCGGGYMDLDVC